MAIVDTLSPPDDTDDGSTARTATLWPREVSNVPRASISVDFPAPGAPDSPLILKQANIANICHG